MKIKITNGAILEAINAISKFGSTSGKLGYAMARTLRILQREIEDYEDAHTKLVQKYGKKTDNGYEINPEKDKKAYESFIKDLMPILNCPIEVEIMQVESDEFDLPYCETATVNDYNLIERLLVVPGKGDKAGNKDE